MSFVDSLVNSVVWSVCHEETGWEDMDWIDLAQGQVAVYREHSHGLLGFIKFGKMCE